MSKGVKTVLSVAAAIAIPFAAPVISSSIGLSTAIGNAFGSATIGSVLGGTVVGSVLGAAKGAAFGENVGRNALMGGIGGGVTSYFSAPTAASTAGNSSYALGGGSGVGLAPPGAGLSGGYGGLTPADYSLTAGAQFPTAGLDLSSTGVGFRAPDSSFFTSSVDRALASGAPIDYSLAAGAPSSTGLVVAPSSGGVSASPGASGSPSTFVEALKQVPGAIKAKFTDPKALADLTLRAAGQLAGSALAGDGLSPEEQALLNAQTEELRRLQKENQGLFRQRLEAAQALIGESRYFDPEYFGLQRARQAQIAGASAKRAGLRGLTGAARSAEARRFDLATGRNVGTAFDVGYGTGVSGRLQTLQAGLSVMPASFPSSATEYGNIRNAYGNAYERTRQQQKDIGSLFGSLTA